MSRTLLLLLAGCAACAQETGSISGQVVNGLTAEPLKKARLLLRSISTSAPPQSFYSAITDASGAFVFREVDPGTYRLRAERNGFVAFEYGSHGPNRSGTTLRVEAGQKLKDIELRMTPQAVLTGRVLDEDGDPAAGAIVTVMRYAYVRGRRQLANAESATADDQGDYRLHSLPPGKYYLSALARWAAVGAGARTDSDDNYAPTFYPNTVDPAAAMQINATAGAVLRGMDLTLAKVRTVRVTGKVVDPGGQPLGRNITVFAMREGAAEVFQGGRSGSTAPGPDGLFVLRGLRPGTYMLGAERWQDNQRSTARLPVTVGAEGAENVTLTLAPPIEVRGRIRVEGSTADVKLAGMNLMLQARSDFAGASTAGGRLQEDGSFTMQNVAPDLYDVTVMGIPLSLYVKAVTWGTDDVLASGLNLMRGGGELLDILLSPSAGWLNVSVTDAKQQPAAGAFVVAVPDGPRAALQQFYKAGTADSQGRAQLRGLAPGDYRLYAWDDVEMNAWLDPEFRKPYERLGESVSIAENAHESKQLTVIATEGN